MKLYIVQRAANFATYAVGRGILFKKKQYVIHTFLALKIVISLCTKKTKIVTLFFVYVFT